MPDSSFFDPMQMGGPGMFPGPGPSASRQTPTFKAGYKNVYGTQTNIGINPVTKQATVDARFPVGDFRNQLFLTGGGYASPATPGQKPDWGVRLGFEKKIAPQGAPMGQLIDQALNQALPAGVQNTGGFSPESRAGMMAAMTNDDRQRLFQNVKAAQNQIIDQQLGVVPGATKYGIDFGVDMKGALEERPNPLEFTKQYASQLQQTGDFVDPNMQRGPGTPGINPNAEPMWDPYTGKPIFKKSVLMY